MRHITYILGVGVGILLSIVAQAQDGVVTARVRNRVGGQVQYKQLSDFTFRISATPSKGYEFLSWSDGSTLNPRDYTHTADVTKDSLFRAIFVKSEDLVQKGGTSSVVIDNPLIPSYTLTATANPDAQFMLWNNGATTQSVSYLEDDGTRIPIFELNEGTVSFFFNQHEGGNITAESLDKMTFQFTAVPNEGYDFLSWIDNVTTNPRPYTHVPDENADTMLRAVFVKRSDVILPGGMVTVSIDNQITPSYNLLQTPGSCATFQIWSNGGTENPKHYIEPDGTVIPVYSHGEHDLIKIVDNREGGYIHIDTLTCGFTLTAVPNPGYCFLYWEDNSTNPIRDVDYIAAIYKATFSQSVARVGDIEYPSIQTAIDNANGEIVHLLINTSEDVIISTDTRLDGANLAMGDITIPIGKQLTFEGKTKINNLYLHATEGASGQLFHQERLTYNAAYEDVTFEVGKSAAQANKWYAFAVPFDVDVATGVSSAKGTPISANDYLIWEYDGEMRATNKSNGWVKLYEGTLLPGHFYMMGVKNTENTWRFRKKDNSPLTNLSSLPTYQFLSSCEHRGWNALANSMLYYANANIDGIYYAQVYDNLSVSGKYDVIPLVECSFVVARPFFIQAKEDGILTFSSATNAMLYAPRRSIMEESDLFYCITLSNGQQSDKLYLTASSWATPTYEIGKDLIKMMGGNSEVYIWSNAYGERLCAENAPLQDDEVEYSLSFSVPKAGLYTLNATKGNRHVFLMYGETMIADLSQGEYTIDLSAGITKGYSLVIGSLNGGLDISTPLNQLSTNPMCEKYIHQGTLYIKANGHLYDARGIMMQ